MTLSTVEKAVLDLAVEDYYQPAEVFARVRESLEGKDDRRRRENLRAILEDLLSRGLLALYRGKQFSGEESPVNASEIAKILSSESTWAWHGAENAGHVRVAATDRGEREYYKR